MPCLKYEAVGINVAIVFSGLLAGRQREEGQHNEMMMSCSFLFFISRCAYMFYHHRQCARKPMLPKYAAPRAQQRGKQPY